MLSGHKCTNVPTSVQSCAHLVEQIPPASSWGRRFATAPLKGRLVYDVFRILASENLTTVVVNCTLSTDHPILCNTTSTYMLNEGRFVEYRASSSQYFFIEGIGNILVLQYSVGGRAEPAEGNPAMIIVPAIKQYCNSIPCHLSNTMITISPSPTTWIYSNLHSITSQIRYS